MADKSPLALSLQKIWENHHVAWPHHRAGYGMSRDEKNEKGFWIVAEYEHVVLKKGVKVPKIRNRRRRK